ncbi:MAG TPA: DUF2127 domain-containing protein [Pirellulales bacterium]|nr:DUF2127 domain-containing protein [Pirellulales bacterium]
MDAGEHGTRHRDWGLLAIGFFKLFKATVLVIVAFGALRLMHQDVADTIEEWARSLHFRDDSRVFRFAINKTTGIDDGDLKRISAGSLFYAVLLTIEGSGLLAARRWAEYVTVFITGSLVPLEIYEIWRHVTAVRIGVLVINVAAVVYLIYRLRADRRHEG